MTACTRPTRPRRARLPLARASIIVETDGFETHGTRAALRADRAKDAALTAAGYRVLRFTRDDRSRVGDQAPARAA